MRWRSCNACIPSWVPISVKSSLSTVQSGQSLFALRSQKKAWLAAVVLGVHQAPMLQSVLDASRVILVTF